MYTSKGFSLVELLVVIAIISSLAALLLPNYMASRERARDTQRKNDLKVLREGLELYKLDQTVVEVPSTDAFMATVGNCWSSEAGCTGNIYVRRIPGDPNRSPATYYYERDASDSLQYTLCACLENIADNDPNVVDGNCAVSYACSSGKSYVLDVR